MKRKHKCYYWVNCIYNETDKDLWFDEKLLKWRDSSLIMEDKHPCSSSATVYKIKDVLKMCRHLRETLKFNGNIVVTRFFFKNGKRFIMDFEYKYN